MSQIVLSPTVACLSQEYLLVPAWKKAHDYVRRQNWYSDARIVVRELIVGLFHWRLAAILRS